MNKNEPLEEVATEEVEATEEATEGVAEDEAVKSILKSIDAKIKTEVNAVKTELNNEVKKWQEKSVEKKKTASLNDLVSNEKLVSFAKSLKKEKGSLSLDIDNFAFRSKSIPGDMSVEGNFDGEVALSELDPMVSRDPQRQPFIEQLVSVGNINAPIDVWIETTDETGAPAPIAELALIPQKDYDFVENSLPVKKIGVRAKYSAEMAEDLPNLVSEVRNFLVADLRRLVDTQILTGDGSGDNLEGILENAITFSAGALASTVPEANNFDVIRAAANQVVIALHQPNYIVCHPTDVASMELSKGDDGHYVIPPFITAGGATVAGLRVIQNTGITQGNFLVGDFSKSSVKYRKGLTVEMSNTDEDDFSRDRFTVRALVRLVHRVRENDYEAFVYGSFATAKAALEAGS